MTTATDIGQKELPAGWKWVKLGDVCVEQRKTISSDDPVARTLPYLSLEHVESQTGLILASPEDIPQDAGKSNTFYFDDRHILYGKLRPYLNKVALPTFRGRCTTELIPLEPMTAIREYLWLLLRRPETVSYAMKGKTGSRMPRANIAELMQMPIPLPPLEEQKRIAGLLNEQMAAVEEAKKAARGRLEAAQALPAAYLREVFPSSEDELPDGWKWVKLGELPINIGDGNYAEKYPKQSEFVDHGIPFIRATNLNNGTVTSHDMRYISHAKHNLLVKGHLKEGDVLIVTRGDIGGVALVPNEHEDSNINAQLVRLRADRQFLNHHYLFFHLQSPTVVGQVNNLLTGSALKQLPIGNLRQIFLSVPPLEDQERIASELDDKIAGVKLAEASIQQELDTIEALPAALLRKAFAGEM